MGDSGGNFAEEVIDEYHRRIKQAFAYLETEVELGRIQWYGISSNTFPRAEDAIDRTSLEWVWQSAEEIAGDAHHFAVVEFPMNIFETGRISERNQRHGTETLLDFCAEKNLGVLVNRPLNAIAAKKLIRLADFPLVDIPPDDDIDDLLHDLKLQEVRNLLRPQLNAFDLDEQDRGCSQTISNVRAKPQRRQLARVCKRGRMARYFPDRACAAH